MNNLSVSNVSFQGVTPIRVLIDGKASADPANIRRAGRALTKILVGPTNKSELNRNLALKYAQGDRDYSPDRALYGYVKMKFQNISDFFRCVNDRNWWYIATGNDAAKLQEAGRNIGVIRQFENHYRIKDSYEIHEAKRDYGKVLNKILNNPNTRAKVNNVPKTLEIQTTSSGTYGKKNFKLKIDDINWV